MKKSLIFAVCSLFVLFGFVGFVSAEITLSDSPSSVYNMGDVIKLPLTLSFEQDFSNLFILSLSCGEGKVEFYKEYIYLSSGESVSKTVFIPLIKDLIKNLRGECSVIYSLGPEENTLVESFQISEKINLELNSNKYFNPGEKLNLRGTAKKDNGEFFVGNLKIFIEGGNSADIRVEKSIGSGEFNLDLIISSDFEAGTHLLSIEAIEFDAHGEQANYGKLNSFIDVAQVPTSLELILEENKINPGETLIFKTVLHDQTGEKIDSKVYAALRNADAEIIARFEGNTGEIFEFIFNKISIIK